MTDSKVVITFSDGSQITETMRYFGEDEFNTIIQWYIDNGAAIVLVNGQTFTPMTTEPTITGPAPSTLEPFPTTELLSVSATLTIINDRVAGNIVFLYGADIRLDQTIRATAFLTVSTPENLTLINKSNSLLFTTLERDETINYNEGAFGHKELKVQVTALREPDLVPLTALPQFTITDKTPLPTPGAPTKIDSTFGKIIAGVFIGGVAIAALGSRRKK